MDDKKLTKELRKAWFKATIQVIGWIVLAHLIVAMVWYGVTIEIGEFKVWTNPLSEVFK